VKFAKFSFVVVLIKIFVCSCVAQTTVPSNARTDPMVSVHELPLPPKAEHAVAVGTRLLLKGDAEGSLAYFLKARDEAPLSFRPYHNLGLAYYNLNQLDAAEENFEKSIDFTNGKFAPSIFGMAMVLYRKSAFQSAENLTLQGLLLQPGSGVGRYCLGLTRFSEGRLHEAEASAREALALDPDETDAHVLLARIHERQHAPSAQLKEAEAYLKAAPNGALRESANELAQRARETLGTQAKWAVVGRD